MPITPTTPLPGAPASGSLLHDPVLHAQWFAVAQSSDVPIAQPIARRLLGADIVLWRDAHNLHAWQDLCIHRGAKLSLGTVRGSRDPAIASTCLVCPYHAWEYNGEGTCVHIPAQPGRTPPIKARANVFHVQERYGLIWVCPVSPDASPTTAVPDFSLAQDPACRAFICGPYTFEAKGPRLIENFLDVGHLAIVHAGLLGDALHAAIPGYEIEPSATGPTARNIRIHQPDPDGTGQPAEVIYDFQVHTVLSASFIKSQGANRLFMGYTITPAEENTSIAWAVFAMNYGHNIPEASLRAFQDKVTLQDKAIVESQRPELLPLDLQQELHLRSDRLAIAYRAWLKTTGLRYGTA